MYWKKISYTSFVSTKTLITLSDVSNKTFSDVSNDSIKISFDHPSGAKQYSIEVSSVSSFNIPSIIITSSTINKYAIFGNGGVGTLLPNTTYYFRVKAYFDNEETGYEPLGERSTDPNIATSINLINVTTMTIQATWSSNGNPANTNYNALIIRSYDSSQVYSSTGTSLNLNYSNLEPNTTYFIKIKSIGNAADSIYVNSQEFKTKVAFTGFSNAAFSNVSTDSFKVSWDDTINGEVSYIVSTYDTEDRNEFLYSSSTVNKYAIFGSGGIGSFSPNTTYYAFVKAKNVDETEMQLIGYTVTLATIATNFDFIGVYSSSVSFTWNANGNPNGTLYKIRYESTSDSGSAFFIGNAGTVNGTITGLKGNTDYNFYISAINHSNTSTTEVLKSTKTLETKETVQEIGSGGGSLIFDDGGGEVKVNIPSDAFYSNVNITVKRPDTIPSSNDSLMGNITPTSIYLEINTGGVQPNKPVEITVDYSSLSSINEDNLVIGRYDNAGLWIPLKSYVDKTNRKVRAYTNHFSVFSLLLLTPSSTISEPKVAPNPLRPSKGLAYSNMTFSNLPSDTDIIIYNVSGVKIRKLKTDSSGIAVWDGKNENGENVSSGVYFALITKGSSNKTIKIGVQR